MLQSEQKALGPDHSDTLSSMNNLAGVLHKQGQYAEAEQLYRDVMARRQSTLGPEHPDTLGSINNLAVVLRERPVGWS